MEFPQFTEPVPIDGRRSWTARFDSFNERTDDLYYIIGIHEDGVVVDRFVVELWQPGDLAAELHGMAVGGVTNTACLGYNLG